MTTMLEHALQAYEAGLCVVPPKGDGSKAPLAAWRKFQFERPTTDDLNAWYGDGTRTGIGAVLGKVSGSVEMFEFDDRSTYEAFIDRASLAGLGALVTRISAGYSEATPNGIHWFYRCEQIEGNTKLAQRLKSDDERKHPNDHTLTLIETRGEGGYGILAPTHGAVHPSGEPYTFISGGYDTIETITTQEREQLFSLARSFDAMPRHEVDAPAKKGDAGLLPADDDERPGDYFNRTREWSDVLTKHGWQKLFQHGGETYWTRPGRDRVTSATTNYAESDLLKVFSTSTQFDTSKTYSKFGAFTLLEHNNDFASAARAVRAEMGNAKAPAADDLIIKPTTEARTVDEETGELIESPQLQRLRKRLLDTDGLLSLPPPEWLIETILPKNSLAVVYGESGVMKSFLAIDWALCAATKTWWKNRAIGDASRVLYIAAEGASGIGKRVRAWCKANNVRNLSNVTWLPEAVNLLDPAQASALEQIVSETKPAMIVVDTLARSMVGGDENSATDMGRLIDTCDRLKVATGACVVLVHHSTKAGGVARGSGSLRGGIDTEIEVKKDGTAVQVFCRKQKDSEEFQGIFLHAVVIDDSVVLDYVSRDGETYGVINHGLETVRHLFRETFRETGVTGAELRTVIMEQCHMSRATALRKINDLVAEGFIANKATGRFPFYERGPNYYGERMSHTSQGVSLTSQGSVPMSHPSSISIEMEDETGRETSNETKPVELW